MAEELRQHDAEDAEFLQQRREEGLNLVEPGSSSDTDAFKESSTTEPGRKRQKKSSIWDHFTFRSAFLKNHG